jgi:lysophospholipase L1-like esterase
MKKTFLLQAFVLFFAANVCQAAWVGTWATSQQVVEPRNLPPAPRLSDNTLRQIVHVSIGGKNLRVKFSNAFGDGPVTIAAARIALPLSGSEIKPPSEKALAFAGKPSVTIPPGQEIFSDAIDFDLAPLSNLTVTIHFGQTPKNVTGHPGSRTTSYLVSGDAISAADLPSAATMAHWYILSGVDVQADDAAAIAVLGDSITDGRGSTTDQNNRWPDDLAQRVAGNQIAILNQGIGGNAILHGGLGPTALSRFDRDVIQQSGVRWVIVLEGVNDIGGSNGAGVAQDLIAAYQKMIDRAHAHHLKIYGATILPFEASQYFSVGHEAVRQTVNEWIRSSGKFDAVIDFDAALRDPQQPNRLQSAADSGDHLHPSAAGYKIMGDAVDVKLFAK